MIAKLTAKMAAKVDDAHKAASSLEAYFLRRVLGEVKTSENSISGGGFAGDTFKDMFDGAIADAMANAGGVGLADVIAKQLDKKAAGASVDAASQATTGSAETSGSTRSSSSKTEFTNRPIPLPHPAGISLHPVSKLVTDPLGNRTLDAQLPAATTVPALPIGTPGTVSLRRYRAAEPTEPAPSSLGAPGRTTERR